MTSQNKQRHSSFDCKPKMLMSVKAYEVNESVVRFCYSS